MSGNKGIFQNITDAASGTAQYATDTAKGGLNFAGDTLGGAKDTLVGKSEEASKNTPDLGKKAEETGSQAKQSADSAATKVDQAEEAPCPPHRTISGSFNDYLRSPRARERVVVRDFPRVIVLAPMIAYDLSFFGRGALTAPVLMWTTAGRSLLDTCDTATAAAIAGLSTSESAG